VLSYVIPKYKGRPEIGIYSRVTGLGPQVSGSVYQVQVRVRAKFRSWTCTRTWGPVPGTWLPRPETWKCMPPANPPVSGFPLSAASLPWVGLSALAQPCGWPRVVSPTSRREQTQGQGHGQVSIP